LTLPKYAPTPIKSIKTTIPFVKDNEFDYVSVLSFMGDSAVKYGWLIFIPIVILIVTAVSNGANITDGIDGLAAGTSAIIGTTLGILAYVSGNTIFADYLNIMYIPNIPVNWWCLWRPLLAHALVSFGITLSLLKFLWAIQEV
jgi:phospho-N-acetylmuramoyl-pentapeptide-transferase